MNKMRNEFTVHLLNETGLANARTIAELFSEFLDQLEYYCGKDGREIAIVRTKLEEANYFAKRAVAMRPENQLPVRED